MGFKDGGANTIRSLRSGLRRSTTAVVGCTGTLLLLDPADGSTMWRIMALIVLLILFLRRFSWHLVRSFLRLTNAEHSEKRKQAGHQSFYPWLNGYAPGDGFTCPFFFHECRRRIPRVYSCVE